jgi:hypothetical protein
VRRFPGMIMVCGDSNTSANAPKKLLVFSHYNVYFF